VRPRFFRAGQPEDDNHGKQKENPVAVDVVECTVKTKEYEKELRRLHVELVKLQQWVVAKGLKVCIVFEGRDGAGKGGTIKAITERVSPRVFRVVALPAPTERKTSSTSSAMCPTCLRRVKS
jgi:polyphosphate kinase 2 (PPK2 family)